MRLLAAVLCLLALAVVGCSKSKANPVAPRLDSRGTQLGTAGTFDEGNLLLWSAATNEILGTASFFGTTFPSGALVAMDGATGATRVLDPETSLFPVAAPAGTPVYYMAFVSDFTAPDNDSLAFRRVALTGGAPARIDACAVFCIYFYTVSGDGAWIAWSSGSIVLESTMRGRTQIAPGYPLLLAPDGSQLLYRAGLFSPELILHDRVAGTDTPFDLGLPPSAPMAGLRWDGSGRRPESR